ncbi:MAG: NAD(P) transhydrogenase subunit alpha [Bacteroidia bacterium]|jgi:NAD(P) transhydrogenase subunit alpha
MNMNLWIAALETSEASASSGTLPFYLIGLWILILASFTGLEIISKVPPTLHTPLMSGANAISGITLVGALYCVFSDVSSIAQVLGFLAIVLATVNVVGGFMVTDRMLAMFGSKKKGGK